MNKKVKILMIAALTSFSFQQSNAQLLGSLKNLVKDKAVEKTTSLVGANVKNLITSEAITTNFKDCDKTNVKEANFGKNEKYTSLCSSTISEKGFELKPGFYQIKLKSFCLKAGTYAPSKGDGYLYAPLKGPKAQIIDKLVKSWANHPEVKQNDVQALIWAIIAKANFKNLSTDLQLVATKLLSSKDLLSLSKMGLDFIPQSTMSDIKSSLPKPVQAVLEAENKMRQLFNSTSYNYGDLEKFAMLAGLNSEKSSIEYGTWGLHPDGYWISYQPEGYSQMTVKIHVPETVKSVYYLPSEDVAVPANTSSQRLLLSDVKNCN